MTVRSFILSGSQRIHDAIGDSLGNLVETGVKELIVFSIVDKSNFYKDRRHLCPAKYCQIRPCLHVNIPEAYAFQILIDGLCHGEFLPV